MGRLNGLMLLAAILRQLQAVLRSGVVLAKATRFFTPGQHPAAMVGAPLMYPRHGANALDTSPELSHDDFSELESAEEADP